ncbi:MAG TPA: allantoate amidohydrolase [Gemmatimonadaceae bacterium]
MIDALAHEVVEWCRLLATFSEVPGSTTRTFLSAPMRDVHERLGEWMTELGMHVSVDAAGNLRGLYDRSPRAKSPEARLFIGSHLDTVPNAGAFDGILGVVLGVALVKLAARRRFAFDIEVVGFSEEEGVRFGVPFIGSRALAGTLDADLLARRDAAGVSVAEAIAAYGLDLREIAGARAAGSIGFLEFHIEQGPQLEQLDLEVGIVDAIAGQTRMTVGFAGAAGHAGTTPMTARRDALAGAAEWIVRVEQIAHESVGLVSTVGRIEASPNATNVIAGECRVSLDVRHAEDRVRASAVERIIDEARAIAERRRLELTATMSLDQPSVPMNETMSAALEESVTGCKLAVQHMVCGAGHDAMTMAAVMPTAMLLLRSPGGISHHPAESVRELDVAAALRVGSRFLDILERNLP